MKGTLPPKKKGKKAKGSTLIDGVDTASMTREQLEAFAHRLKNEMEREREERNFFQLERDKLRTFWEITRNQLEESRAAIRNKDREVEVAQELAEIDIKHVVQQMKHLQYENQTRLGELRAESMAQLKIAQEDHANQEEELLRDKRELRRLLREKEEATELQLQQLKMQHSELLSKEREKFETEGKEITALYDQKLNAYVEESEIRHQMEMFEIEERKSTQIFNLIESHENAFMEMKTYYTDITLNNLALISSLKEKQEELRVQSDRSERLLAETTAENRKLSEPLQQAEAELVELRRKVENYDRVRIQLTRVKSKYSTAQKELENLKWEMEALNMRTSTFTEEQDKLKTKFEEAILELQQKTGLKSVLLERKLSVMQKEAEKREAVLGEALAAAGMQPQQLSVRIDTLLQEKNDLIQDLKYELARVCKAHDDLLATYEAKMRQFGIPKEELGFEPLRTSNQIKLGSGPAGLVSRNQ